MKRIAGHSFTIARRSLGYGLIGAFISLLAIAIYVLEQRAELHIWHEVQLDEEFTSNSKVKDFADYLKLEERLFKQLEEEVYQKTGAADPSSINRYEKGSVMDPTSMAKNWNRTFEMRAADPAAGVLLLHGMSDSPYSLRHIGESLHASGASVIGLRIPGHGTAPSGLVRTTWKDMAAAVKIAVKHLRKSVGDKPIYLIGYSNGGALSVEYALESLHDGSLPKVQGIVLVSPAIGITSTAALAVWQGRLGRWFDLKKLAWNSISLEYDPFKYGSFAVNAGDQAYRITLEIDKRIAKLSESGKLGDFPPVLAFTSAVDATVSAPDLVSRLFDKLPDRGHELVVYDLNREAKIKHMLKNDPAKDLATLLSKANPTFTLSIISNGFDNDDRSADVKIRRRRASGTTIETIDPGLQWPEGMYSLSHIALPFPASDPLYGAGNNGESQTLGNLTLRGERGAIRIPSGDMLRQRWNPFYPYFKTRVHEFCHLENPSKALKNLEATSP